MICREKRLRLARDAVYMINRSSYINGTEEPVHYARELLALIGGHTEPERSRKYFGTLVVGFYEGKNFRFAGRVGVFSAIGDFVPFAAKTFSRPN
jgi:hypothetical protein